ncbi:MAG: HD domain-containing protein [Sphingobacteriales bacterium]|nr:HD domain-containing protein [Sphingobacteriales bacterium]MBI3720092.1 HD domain-containing protein [Sphingobacteriales bacterium]
MHQQETIAPDYERAVTFILESLKTELPSNLYYHGYHHTVDVMDAAERIAATENLSAEEKGLLQVAVAFHDAGFIYTYKNHEERGCDLAEELLPGFGFNKEQIEAVCAMIRATKTPQRPKTKLEKIICDADLDYLGRDDVYAIAGTLLEEVKIYSKKIDEKAWDELQINFLKNHHYYTSFSLEHRAKNKQEYLDGLIKKWNP